MSGTVLFVASNPTAIQFDFAGELTAMKEALRSRPSGPKILARWSVSGAGLKKAVSDLRPEIVHLLSPGVDQITNALVMADAQGRPEYAQPDAIAAAFAATPAHPPKLVVLNTCHSRQHGEAIAPNVGCAIAMDGVIYDTTAIEFARELYLSLAHGSSVEHAFVAAKAVSKASMAGQGEVPVLLRGRLDPAGITFQPAAPRPQPAGPAAAIPTATRCAKIFCSYAHEDEKYRAELETHLALLVRDRTVDVWHDRQIIPGQDWAREIDENLDHASIVLLLISADFLASQYCYGIEMARAIERARAGAACVVPILVRKCDLQGVPFAGFQWLPTNSKPVKNWSDRDSAWTDVAQGIRKVVQQIGPVGTDALSR
jgi:hypothetical protein